MFIIKPKFIENLILLREVHDNRAKSLALRAVNSFDPEIIEQTKAHQAVSESITQIIKDFDLNRDKCDEWFIISKDDLECLVRINDTQQIYKAHTYISEQMIQKISSRNDSVIRINYDD